MVMVLHPMNIVHQQIFGFFGDFIIEADTEAADNVGSGFNGQLMGAVPDVGVSHGRLLYRK